MGEQEIVLQQLPKTFKALCRMLNVLVQVVSLLFKVSTTNWITAPQRGFTSSLENSFQCCPVHELLQGDSSFQLVILVQLLKGKKL